VDNREDRRTIVEDSPKKSSRNNGLLERAVQAVEGKIWVMVDILEARLGLPFVVQVGSLLLMFLTECAAH